MQPLESVPLPRYEANREPVGPVDRETVDTDAIIEFIRKSWRLWVIWIAAGICLGLAFLGFVPGKYKADAVLLFDSGIVRPSAGPSIVPDVSSAFVDGQVQVLGSDEVLGRVVDQHHLVQSPELGAGVFATEREARQAAILRIRAALSISRIGISNAVQVAFASNERLRSADIVNAIVNGYIEGRLELKRQAAAEWISELRERLAELRKKAFTADASSE